jgi:methyl-accepting chemotaxis protein
MSNKPTSPKKRRLANFYLTPSVQSRYALINAASVVVGMWIMSFLAYRKLPLFIDSAVNGTPIELEPGALLSYTIWSFVFVTIVMSLFSFVLSVVLTHRMVGPVFVFERHVRALLDGNYKSRINLRREDDFKELSVLLNQLAEKLETKTENKNEDGKTELESE